MMASNYSPTVAQLLSYEECQPVPVAEWPDYVDTLGFTQAQIPDLVKLMQDHYLYEWNPEKDPPLPEEFDPELSWCGPIHAWRTLGQLKAVEFAEGALPVLQTALKEWAMEEFPDVCQLIGPDIVEPLGIVIQENISTENDVAALIESLSLVPENYPEARDRCVAILQRALETHPQNSHRHNTFLVLALQNLKATEAVDVIEAAYQAQRIDEMFVGTWANTQVELGLKSESDFTEAELTPKLPPEMQQMRDLLLALERQQKPNAFELGMPIDSSSLPSSKPTHFNKMLKPKQELHHDSSKGFGGTQKSHKKGKKKKK